MLLVNFSDVSQGNLKISEIKGLVYASKCDIESAINEIEKSAERKDADGIINIQFSVTESTVVGDAGVFETEYATIRTFTVIGTAVKFDKNGVQGLTA